MVQYQHPDQTPKMTRENYHQANQYTPSTEQYTPDSSREVIDPKKLREMVL